MSSINGASHCHQKAPAQRQNTPAGGAYGGNQVGGGAPVQQGQHGGPQFGSPGPLANTMVASQQLNNGWQGRQDGRTRVAVIDDFASGHGNQIDSIVRGGGRNGVETVRFNINNGGNRTRNIASSLDQIAQLAAQGQHFDAINISQQDFANNGDTAAVRQKIDFLQRQFGIPVVVAAGNNAAGVRNALAGSAAFVVENSVPGTDFRAAGSAGGNVRAEGQFTSQAAANVTARVAQLREMGYSFGQIQQFLNSAMFAEGGSLNGF